MTECKTKDEVLLTEEEMERVIYTFGWNERAQLLLVECREQVSPELQECIDDLLALREKQP